eukprot:jgi/Ulvmu1/5874/UM250_0002.1
MSLADVYELLRGSTDEHKFAGLALLPRVCTPCTNPKYEEIYEAISLEFIWRLLVPLRDPRFIASVENSEDVQKQLLGVTIALSVLSLLSREKAVASDADLIELIPTLARLIRSPSLALACGRRDEGKLYDSYPEDVHKDAIELLWNLCRHGDDAVTIARQSNSISSVSTWLAANFTIQPPASSQCALLLLLTLLEPYLSQGAEACEQPTCDQTEGEDYTELSKQLQAAVSGIAAMCVADCSRESCIQKSLQKLALRTDSTSTHEELQSIQLQGFGILAAAIPCLAWATKLQQGDESLLDLAWAEDLKEAALRALRSRLPLHHLLHVMSALHALVDLQGADALLMGDTRRHSGQQVSSLVTTLVQVLKVQVYSHLQGCVLHVQASGVVSVLPENLQGSEAIFIVSVRLLSSIVDLVILIEEVQDRSGVKSGRGHLSTNAEQAMSEGRMLEVLKALEESVSSMLDFISFIAAGTVVEGPEPQQIPKGFGPVADHTDIQPGTCGTATSDHVEHDSAEQVPRKLSSFIVQPFHEGICEAVGAWVPRTMKACCHSTGMLVSLAGGVNASTKLLRLLPDLCTWVCSWNAPEPEVDGIKTPLHLITLIEPFLSALYAVHNLQVSGAAVASSCAEVLQNPKVFMLVGLCCVTIVKRRLQCKASLPSEYWQNTLASDAIVACQLVASAVCILSKAQLNSVEGLYLQLWQHRGFTPSLLLLPEVVVACNELLCTLAVAMPAHVGSAVDCDEDATAIIDGVGALAAVISATVSQFVAPDDVTAEVVSALQSVCGAVRLMLEVILTCASSGQYDELVRTLVSLGEEESTTWRSAKDHLLLACLHEGINTEEICNICCGVCTSASTAIEVAPSLATEVYKGTWFGSYMQIEDGVETLCTALEQTGQSVSVGHALRALVSSICNPRSRSPARRT